MSLPSRECGFQAGENPDCDLTLLLRLSNCNDVVESEGLGGNNNSGVPYKGLFVGQP
jgi:hypothetical protein